MGILDSIKGIYDKYVKNKDTTDKTRKYRSFPLKRIDSWDKRISVKIHRRFAERRKAIRISKAISYAGDPRLWGPVLMGSFLYGIISHNLGLFILYLGGLTFTYLIYYIIKNSAKRKRPYLELEEIQRLDKTGHGYSFPSGHSHHSAILMGLTLLYLGADFSLTYLILIPYSIAVSVSRIINGVHYPSDVIFAILEGYMELFIYWVYIRPYIILFAAYIFNPLGVNVSV